MTDSVDKKEYIYSLDIFRLILAYCVVVGHTFIVLIREKETDLLAMQNLAVDGFFILSGFLLALSCSKYSSASPSDLNFINLMKKKFNRLYPEYLFSIIITYIMSELFLYHISLKDLPYNLLFISQINNISGIVNGSWYVSVLFWCSLIYSALLIYKRKTAVYIYIPLITFCSFTYMYSTYTGLSLNGLPLIYGVWSSGFLKGFLGMGVGIMVYNICQSLSDNKIQIRYLSIITAILEVCAIYIIARCMNIRHLSQKEYLVYFAYTVLICLYYFHKEKIIKLFTYEKFKFLANSSYMIFLTHCVLLEVIKKYIPYKNYSDVIVYVSVVIVCTVFALICYYLQKLLFAKLKQILFIPQAENSSLNVENLEKEREREGFTKLHQGSN